MIVHNSTVDDLRLATDRVLAVRLEAGTMRSPALRGLVRRVRRTR